MYLRYVVVYMQDQFGTCNLRSQFDISTTVVHIYYIYNSNLRSRSGTVGTTSREEFKTRKNLCFSYMYL